MNASPAWRTIIPRAVDELVIMRWDDPLLEAVGVPVSSSYVETYWLPVLGPTATWLARRLADSLEDAPVSVGVSYLGRSLGVGSGVGANCPLVRALARLRRFGVVRERRDLWDVRTVLGAVPAAQLKRLPQALLEDHAQWAVGHAKMVG